MFAICGKFREGSNRGSLDGSAPIFRIALMGAGENAETKSKSVETSFSPSVLEKLDLGWVISETAEGQLLLVPPSSYGEPEGGRA